MMIIQVAATLEGDLQSLPGVERMARQYTTNPAVMALRHTGDLRGANLAHGL